MLKPPSFVFLCRKQETIHHQAFVRYFHVIGELWDKWIMRRNNMVSNWLSSKSHSVVPELRTIFRLLQFSLNYKIMGFLFFLKNVLIIIILACWSLLQCRLSQLQCHGPHLVATCCGHGLKPCTWGSVAVTPGLVCSQAYWTLPGLRINVLCIGKWIFNH